MNRNGLWILLLFSITWAAQVARGQGEAYDFSTLAGMTGIAGSADGTNGTARFNSPAGLAMDSVGNVYVADILNETIRKVTPLGTNWVVTTICGLAGVPGSSDGTNSDARFDRPNGVAMDSAGTLFVADHYNHTIRRIVPIGTNWVVTTIAGSAGQIGSADGTNSNARFWSPTGIAVDGKDRVFVADTANFIVREIVPQGTNWVVSTIAGSVPINIGPNPGFMDGTNGDAQFNFPYGIALGQAGRLYVVDWGNNAVRQIENIATNWVVTTIAGVSGAMGSNDGPGLIATFNLPNDLRVGLDGNIYVTDQGNDTIRKLSPSQGGWIVSTIGSVAGQAGGADGLGSAARFRRPWGIAIDGAGDLYVADWGNQTIREGVPIPVLGIAVALPNVLLSWPSAISKYTLEARTTFDPSAVWSPITNTPATNGLNLVVADQLRSSPVFYRLHKY